MNKLLLVLILPLMILQPLLLPANAQAADIVVDCPIIVTFTTLPATEITNTTAVLNSTLSEVIRGRILWAQQEDESPWVFEYGTTSGVYPYRVNADMVTESDTVSIDGEDIVITWIVTFRGTVSNLSPCTTYYSRFRYLDTIPIEEECLEVIGPTEISFTTIGCPTFIGTGSHGTGGVNGLTTSQPTNLSNIVVQSATITSAKVSPGENVDVTANVINKGGSNGAFKLTLYINNQEVESKGITLTSGESTQVHFSVSQNDPGTYSVYVNGVPAGNLTVDLFTNNDALIYGVIALFTIGIIGTLYLLVRRRTM